MVFSPGLIPAASGLDAKIASTVFITVAKSYPTFGAAQAAGAGAGAGAAASGGTYINAQSKSSALAAGAAAQAATGGAA